MSVNRATLESTARALLSISQAARRLGVSRVAVYNALARGDLERVMVAGRIMVSTHDVAAYRAKRARRLRPADKDGQPAA